MNLGKYIDHTILKADTSREDIIRVCKEAIDYKFCSVCVNPYYVSLVSKELKNSDVKVTSVIGFPLGASVSKVKAFEAKLAVEDGADEIDMVINIAALKNKDYDFVFDDIKAVVDEVEGNGILKVIIETCLLTDEEKVKACEISKLAGADFVKTSTGFSSAGAKYDDVKLMRKTVGNEMGVKASGGVRTIDDAKLMIDAGANRLGASSSVAIVTGDFSKKSDY